MTDQAARIRELEGALAGATSALEYISVECFPSRQGAYKRTAAANASARAEEALAKLRALTTPPQAETAGAGLRIGRAEYLTHIERWLCPILDDSSVGAEVCYAIGVGRGEKGKAMAERRAQVMLAALQSAKPADGWRDISEAPKDGARIICMRNDDRSLPWGAYWRKYFDGSEGWSNEDGDETRPTHFMPLPQPPQGKP
jgi:hypothetical protein